MSTNFGAAADDYRRFRAGFPDSFFDRLAALGIGGAGITVVDVGTGTGAFVREFVRRGARAIGIDPDDRMLNQARQIDRADGLSIEYKVGRAEQIPLPDAYADLVSAGQCWHWFDGPKAAGEFARVAKPSGRDLESFSYDVDVPYTPEAWRGRIRASVGVGASLEPEEVRAFDAAHERLLAEAFSGEVLHAPHRIFAVLGVRSNTRA